MKSTINNIEEFIKREIIDFAISYRNFEISKSMDGHGDECNIVKFAQKYKVNLITNKGKD